MFEELALLLCYGAAIYVGYNLDIPHGLIPTLWLLILVFVLQMTYLAITRSKKKTTEPIIDTSPTSAIDNMPTPSNNASPPASVVGHHPLPPNQLKN